MFYTVYKITNSINNKIYIGVHKTKDINDDYMGSGKILKLSQEKYGIENFKKEMIAVFDNPEDMFKMESELVNEDFVQDTETYNLKIGGFGGWDFINENDYANNLKHGKLGGISSAISRINNPDIFIVTNILSSERMKIMHQNKLVKYDNFKGKNHTEETKKKIGEANSKHQTGEGNSQFGSIWVHSLEEKKSKKIPKDEIIPDGWLKGRKMKF